MQKNFPPNAENNPCYKKNAQEYRISIRKEQINEQFNLQRWKIMQAQLQQSQKQLARELYSDDKKKQWINSITLQMAGYPCSKWEFTLTKISKALLIFKNQFDQWLKAGIIKGLTELFKQQYKHLKLSSQSALILSNIVYLNDQRKDLVPKMMEYQFIENLVAICDKESRHMSSYMSLLGNLASNDFYTRDCIVSSGAASILVQWSNQLYLRQHKNSYNCDVHTMLYVINSFIRIFEVNGFKKSPKFSIANVFIPVLGRLISSETTTKTIKQSLSCLLSIVTMGKQSILSNLFHSKNLCSSIINLCSHNQSEVRLKSITFLTHMLYSNNKTISKYFIKQNILTKLYECYLLKNDNSGILINQTLCCLTNIMANSEEDVDSVIYHQVFQIIIASTHTAHKISIQRDALYCLHTLSITKKYNYMEYLIKQNNILQVLMISLNYLHDKDAQATIDILETITDFIEVYQNIYHSEGCHHNKIISILQSLYNLTSILNDIFHHNKNKLVHVRASVLLDIISNE